MISADTNIYLYAANPASPHHESARCFFDGVASDPEFVVCELVLVELYMQLRNSAVMRQPLTGSKAASFCLTLRAHPTWQHVDYISLVSAQLWDWACRTKSGFRHIIDARLALTLLHSGVTDFATANVKDFQSFGFRRVWNPTT